MTVRRQSSGFSNYTFLTTILEGDEKYDRTTLKIPTGHLEYPDLQKTKSFKLSVIIRPHGTHEAAA